MNLELEFTKLEELSNKLNALAQSYFCPVVNASSVEYDLLMEFKGTYEDLNLHISEIPDILTKKRYQQRLEKHFKQ